MMRVRSIGFSALAACAAALPLFVAGGQTPDNGSPVTCAQALEFVNEQAEAGVDLLSIYEKDEVEWARDTTLSGVQNCRPVPANLVARYRGLPPVNMAHKRMNCHLAVDALYNRFGNDMDAMPGDTGDFFYEYVDALRRGQSCPKVTPDAHLFAKGHNLTGADEMFWTAGEAGDSDAVLEIALYRLQNGEPQAGFDNLSFASTLGNPWANLEIAELYRAGAGVAEDPAESHRYTLLAAQTGLNWAMVSAGRNFELGYGTQRNPAEAIKWYRKAAEQGHLAALPLAALLIEKGDGVRRDRERAYELLRTAAGAGDTHAMSILGFLLLKRNDGDVSEEGIAWIDKALARGHPTTVAWQKENGEQTRRHFANLSERQKQRREQIRSDRAKRCTNTVNHCVTYVSTSNYSSQRICNTGIDYWNC
ncbi:hypothetical protein CD351_11940 [Erythrobacter sp. KY5]|uniref:tetratricopeptide repeat protein n=1 Tax=Erythrobacter sp. KY5 TaxID=2011159 RepID=UPI000DBF0398|nr:tetratricopeptide repeat protein [Erythrobacter sp. KY5]AWW75138.1 hypothetical protein CD351_11940 [Erythrobacter sp. KY5]